MNKIQVNNIFTKYYSISIKLLISIVLSLLLLNWSNNCGALYIMEVWPGCQYMSWLVFGQIAHLNIVVFLFCLTFVLVTTSFFSWSFKTKYLKYILNPLFLTIIGLFIYSHCSGFICISSGYGFPLSYYNGGFNVVLLLIDFIFFIIINFLFLKIYKFLSKFFNNKK